MFESTFFNSFGKQPGNVARANCRGRPRRGITLMEVLTVLAIITTLCAMIFPALSAARERARATSCMNHLKQIGLALNMFVDVKDGRLPNLGNNEMDQKGWEPSSWGAFYQITPYLEKAEYSSLKTSHLPQNSVQKKRRGQANDERVHKSRTGRYV